VKYVNPKTANLFQKLFVPQKSLKPPGEQIFAHKSLLTMHINFHLQEGRLVSVTRNNINNGDSNLEIICVKIGPLVVSGETDQEYTVEPGFEIEG
jgi:hypothetical protein